MNQATTTRTTTDGRSSLMKNQATTTTTTTTTTTNSTTRMGSKKSALTPTPRLKRILNLVVATRLVAKIRDSTPRRSAMLIGRRSAPQQDFDSDLARLAVGTRRVAKQRGYTQRRNATSIAATKTSCCGTSGNDGK